MKQVTEYVSLKETDWLKTPILTIYYFFHKNKNNFLDIPIELMLPAF